MVTLIPAINPHKDIHSLFNIPLSPVFTLKYSRNSGLGTCEQYLLHTYLVSAIIDTHRYEEPISCIERKWQPSSWRLEPIQFGIRNLSHATLVQSSGRSTQVSNVAACVPPDILSCSNNLEFKFIFIQMIHIRILMAMSVLSSQQISLLV